MTSIIEVKAYQTSDGKIFNKTKDAIEHQQYLDFCEWYYEHRIVGEHNDADMYEWLKEHRKYLTKIVI